jgi:ornithine cyclodeaminase
MVDYIGIESIQKIVRQRGAAAFIEGLAGEIERLPALERFRQVGAPRHPFARRRDRADADQRRPEYSFKYVNGHPKNTAEGLLTVTAFGVLADVDTGYPLLLSELTITTALRTAAMSALAAKWMARPDSRVMALIGNGAQSEFQAIAFHHMLGIREMRLFDIDAPPATSWPATCMQWG